MSELLQARGIPDPTTLDVRGYYQFGPGDAASIAQALDNQIAVIVPFYPAKVHVWGYDSQDPNYVQRSSTILEKQALRAAQS